MAAPGLISRRTPTAWASVGWYLTVAEDNADRDTITDHGEGQCVWVKDEQRLFFWSEADTDWVEIGSTPDGVVDNQILLWSDANSAWEPGSATLRSCADVVIDSGSNGGTLFYDSVGGEFAVRPIIVPDIEGGDRLLNADGTVALDAQLNGGGNKIINVAGGTAPGEVVTYNELDASIRGLEHMIDAVVTGLSHAAAVLSIVNDPPATVTPDTFYIVGAAPTGAWVGHAGQVAWKESASAQAVWLFSTPSGSEARLVESEGAIYTYNDATDVWVKTASTSVSGGAALMFAVGDIRQSVLTESQFKATLTLPEAAKWVLADGRDVSGTNYAQITGTNAVPDLRGAFLRMAGQSNSNTSWNGGSLLARSEDYTRSPRNIAFTTGSAGAHSHPMDNAGSHQHSIYTTSNNYNQTLIKGYRPASSAPENNGNGSWSPGDAASSNGDHVHNLHQAGAHGHNIYGGDTETKPKSVSLNFYIKIN